MHRRRGGDDRHDEGGETGDAEDHRRQSPGSAIPEPRRHALGGHVEAVSVAIVPHRAIVTRPARLATDET
ncbi:hypothetical protein ASG04_01575 [Curtobacterium sp. Leaf183]|nr:hypothetical protein ASG04_01575 [Curtobacterium sp. Leaf183]